MIFPVFLAFCIGLVSSFHVNDADFQLERPEPVVPELVTDDDCACTKDPIPQCGCCYNFELEQKQHKVCTNISFVKDEKALRFTVTLDGKVLVNETLSAKNPPPFCQGIKPFAYICEKYSNMSYGDENKWGGCLEIYGGVVIQILDLKLGCFYLPVDTQQVKNKIAEKPALPSQQPRFTDFLKETLVQEFQRWFKGKFGNTEMFEQHQEKKKDNPLKNILFKNRVDIEIPDIN